MDERLNLVARLFDGANTAVLCQESDASRKTGYKNWSRYKVCGLKGLTDCSHRPYRQANQLPLQVEKRIVQVKPDHPNFGAPRFRKKL